MMWTQWFKETHLLQVVQCVTCYYYSSPICAIVPIYAIPKFLSLQLSGMAKIFLCKWEACHRSCFGVYALTEC